MPTNQNSEMRQNFSKEEMDKMFEPKSGFYSAPTEKMNSSDSSPIAPMTFGEKLVGLTFNPSKDDKVAVAKRLCAQLMDLVNSERENRETTQLENILYNHTVGEILNAQMNVVKLLTLKY